MNTRSSRQREIFIRPPHDAALRFDAAPAVVGGIGRAGILSGYGLLWNVVSSDRGGYSVRLRPGSARFAPETHFLFNHEYRDVVGTTVNNTLRLMRDMRGVRFALDVADTSIGRDLIELVRRRDVRGCSFGIADTPKYVETVEGGLTIRDYTDYLVDELTATPIPAFVETTIGVADGGWQAPLIGYSRRRTWDGRLSSLTPSQQKAVFDLHAHEFRQTLRELELIRFESLKLPPALA